MGSARLSTLARVVQKSVLHPSVALKRAVETVKRASMDEAEEREKLFEFLDEVFDVDAAAMYEEYLQSGFPEWFRAREEALAAFEGPYRFASTPQGDCESLFLLVRALRPRVVVETGVCYGASSAYILEALEQNGAGELYSIDLGNPAEEPPNDFFVPRSLNSRWRLIIGDSRNELPPLLDKLGSIDLFHHDSLHTFEHMMWEYETAFPFITPEGALSSHDVITLLDLTKPFQPSPFAVFGWRHNLRWQTSYNFGIATR